AITTSSENAISNKVGAYCLALWVTSASTVSPVACSSSFFSSFMASLKFLTAPPTSLPALRSFLVPNTNSTITRTTSQCQILKEPIYISLISSLRFGQAGAAAKHMYVNMKHFLTAFGTGIDHGAETLQSLLRCQCWRQQ